MSMLDRILIVGLGSIGTRHAQIVRELLPNAQVAALRRPGSDVTDVPGIDQSVNDVAAALHFRPHAVVIANPASHHVEAALPFAEQGIHLLIEKPLSCDSVGVRHLLDVARHNSAIVVTGYNLRFLCSLEKFREAILEGAVGRVLSVRAEIGQYLPDWRPNRDYRQTVSAQAALGGGALLELSHEIDYLRWIFGEVTSVNASLHRHSDLEIDVEDTAHLVMQFDAVSDLVGVLHMDFVRHDTTRQCTVIGEAGSLRWNGLQGTVEQYRRGGRAWQTVFSHREERNQSYCAEWRNFLDCIAGKSQPRISGEDGLAVVRIVEAARESAKSQTMVKVDHGHRDSRSGDRQ